MLIESIYNLRSTFFSILLEKTFSFHIFFVRNKKIFQFFFVIAFSLIIFNEERYDELLYIKLGLWISDCYYDILICILSQIFFFLQSIISLFTREFNFIIAEYFSFASLCVLVQPFNLESLITLIHRSFLKFSLTTCQNFGNFFHFGRLFEVNYQFIVSFILLYLSYAFLSSILKLLPEHIMPIKQLAILFLH